MRTRFALTLILVIWASAIGMAEAGTAHLSHARPVEGILVYRAPEGTHESPGWMRGCGDILLMDKLGQIQRNLTWPSAGLLGWPNTCESAARWSPDGTQIAFHADSHGGTFDGDIYLMDSNGSHVKRLTETDLGDAPTAWSPDGSEILFVRAREHRWHDFGTADLMRLSLRTGRVTRVTRRRGYEGQADWSPVTNRIVFMGDDGTDYELFTIDPDGTDLIQITENFADEGQPRWSPDGRWIMYTRTEGLRRSSLWMARADGSDPYRLSVACNGNSGYGLWSPNGEEIAFIWKGQIRRSQDTGLYRDRLTRGPDYFLPLDWR